MESSTFPNPGIFELLGSHKMASRGSENIDERGNSVFTRLSGALWSDSSRDP